MTSRRHGSCGNLNLERILLDTGEEPLIHDDPNNETRLTNESTSHKLAIHNSLNLRIQRKLLSKQVLINDGALSSSPGSSSIKIEHTEGKNLFENASPRTINKSRVLNPSRSFDSPLKNKEEKISLSGQSLLKKKNEGSQIRT
ncbi:unnamed protein product, partial [Allacma fusca]